MMMQFLPILILLGFFYLLFCKKMLSVYQKLYISPLSPLFINSVFKLSFCVTSCPARHKQVFLCFSPLFLVNFYLFFFRIFPSYCLMSLNISSYFLQQLLHHLRHQCIFTYSHYKIHSMCI